MTAAKRDQHVQVVSITEDFDQAPGNAVITLTGLSRLPRVGNLHLAFRQPGNQEQYLGSQGWQPAPCWFSVPVRTTEAMPDCIKFTLSPDLALEMEPRAYELLLKAGHESRETVFYWPEIREPEDKVAAGTTDTPVLTGYISEAETTDQPPPEFEPADYDPDQIDFEASTGFVAADYQPASFDTPEKFAEDTTATPPPIPDTEAMEADTEQASAPEDPTDSTGAATEVRTQGDSDAPAPEMTDAASLSDDDDTLIYRAPRHPPDPGPAPSPSTPEPPPAPQVPGPTAPDAGRGHGALIAVIVILLLLFLLGLALWWFSQEKPQEASPAPNRDVPAAQAPPPEATPTPAPSRTPQPTREAPEPTTARPEPAEPVVPIPAGTKVVANDDVYQVELSDPTPLNVLVNDEGEELTIDGIVQKPSHGLVRVDPTQILVYVWLSDQPGDDLFTYRIRDKYGRTAMATVTIRARQWP